MATEPIIAKDNLFSARDLTDHELGKLQRFVGRSVKELAGRQDMLIVPSDFSSIKDGIADEPLFSFCGKRLKVGNLVGFWGVDDVSVMVHSRFDSAEHQFFFHYMLQRVLGVHIVDWQTTKSNDPIWDFLIYLFPIMLKRAYRQGIFRAYRTFGRNDDRLNGSIDVSRHLCLNLPFTGDVAYTTREYAPNNPVNHLARHVIEVIRVKCPSLLMLDNDIRSAVRAIVDVTPNYSRHDRRKVVAQNLKPVRHPYLTEYTQLQKLCLQILRHEKISYGAVDNKIHGIIFDAAWLWEEYIWSVLKNCPLDLQFKHPQNKLSVGAIYLFEKVNSEADICTHSRCSRFPDYYTEKCGGIILDAKYKRLENGVIDRDDMHQIISYMHVQKARNGGYAFPYESSERELPLGTLRGFGGKVFAYGVGVPSECETFEGFISGENGMKASEEKLLAYLMKFRNDGTTNN